MSNFVKIKKDDKYFILNTESVESVLPDAPGSIIKFLNGDTIRTFAEIDDIAAAIIPADGKPVTLGREETVFRRRYYHNDAHAGFILYANESDFDDEMKGDVIREMEGLGGKVEFKNIFIYAPASDDKSQELAEPIADGKSLTVEVAPGYFLTRTPGKVRTSTPGVSFREMRNIISAAISEAAFQAEPAHSDPQSHLPESEAPQ
ncbi:hypothetical protein ACF3VQ_01915 [Yersinia sp. HM-2024]|uniref:hypothetical protein n=1 Tax=Yersinia sp. HM-2024 TaxID=3344550 RepID=UPI00370DD908